MITQQDSVLDGLDASRRVAWAKHYELRRGLISEITRISALRLSLRFPVEPPEKQMPIQGLLSELMSTANSLFNLLGSISDSESELFDAQEEGWREGQGWIRYQPLVERTMGPFLVPILRPQWILSTAHVYVFAEHGTHIVEAPAYEDNPYDRINAWIWAGEAILSMCGQVLHTPAAGRDQFGNVASIYMGTRFDMPMCQGCLNAYTDVGRHH